MKRRRSDTKIPDIKAVRTLTSLLGKFGVSHCYRTYKDLSYEDFCRHHSVVPDEDKLWKKQYGFGLKEAKDYVESKYIYYAPHEETEADRVRGTNMIHLIKRTRQVMFLLNKLGIKSAGFKTGLYEAKNFVTRHG